MKKKIVGARADKKGNITHVQIEGNKRMTGLETAMNMVDKGKVEGVNVRPSNGTKGHLRTLPDNKRRNNLDDMAGV